jgi:hypothetical protein
MPDGGYRHDLFLAPLASAGSILTCAWSGLLGCLLGILRHWEDSCSSCLCLPLQEEVHERGYNASATASTGLKADKGDRRGGRTGLRRISSRGATPAQVI